MEVEGGCYCGAVRYKTDSSALFKGMCFCRECQYISGGGANYVMGVAEAGFAYTKGEAKGFARSDLDNPVTWLTERLASGDANLFTDEVFPRDLFGHWVLDLDAGVELDEVELIVRGQ